jgi:hypothetical protein
LLLKDNGKHDLQVSLGMHCPNDIASCVERCGKHFSNFFFVHCSKFVAEYVRRAENIAQYQKGRSRLLAVVTTSKKRFGLQTAAKATIS